MTPTDYQSKILAKVNEGEAHTRELIEQHGQLFDSTIESMLAPYRALRAVLMIRERNDSDHFNPVLNAQAAVRNNTLDLVLTEIAKELDINE